MTSPFTARSRALLRRTISRPERVARARREAERDIGQVEKLDTILAGYRQVALVQAGVLLTLVVVGLASYGFNPVPTLTLLTVTTAGLAGLVMGHRLVRLRVVAAARAMRAGLALVHRDALTGVFARAYFMQALRAEVYHGSDKVLGYLLLDMDNLKVINDGSGHAAGDAALVHLAKLVGQVMPGAIVGRLGGDEFGIALPGCDSEGALRRLAEELLRRLDRPANIAGRPTSLSATIGIALAPRDASDVDDLIAKADLALYQGKKAGRRQVVAFDPDMLGDERHRRFIERELRAALLMDELELYYQPVFDGQMRLRSHEALVRWRHPVRGTISPAQFVPIAEESDLIDKLGDWVLHRACADLDRLGTPVAVNISAAQLRRGDFARRFADVLAECGAAADRLIVEITETVPLVAGAIEQANLEALRASGIKVAIDDFGAGHASLQYLRGFAFDIIKIDRSYVANLGDNRIDAMIVAAICDIARSLDVEVIAEGVETEIQLDLLRRAGCSAFQGYLLGRPSPLAARQVANAA